MSVIRLAYLDDREKHERMLFLSQKGVRYVRKRKGKLKKTKTTKRKIKKKKREYIKNVYQPGIRTIVLFRKKNSVPSKRITLRFESNLVDSNI